MRKILLLFIASGFFYQAKAQSGLYQTGLEKKIDDAYELFDKHHYSASKLEFENLKEEELTPSQRIDVDFYHAVSALKIENPDGPSLVENITKNYPTDPKANEAAFLLGDYYFEKRHYKVAIEKYNMVNVDVVSLEDRSKLYFKTGYAYFQLKDYANAARYFDPVKKMQTSYTGDGYYYAGYVAMELQKHDQAIADFKQADRYPEYQPKVPYMLSELYYRQQQYDELIDYATPIIQSRNNLDRKEGIYLLLAEAYYERRDFNNAATYYDAFSKTGRGNMSREQMYKAGVAQFKVQKYQQSTDYFKKVALENDRLGQVSSYYLGHSYLKLNNPQYAVTSFSTAYKSDFDSNIQEEALFNFAKLNLEKGSFQEAINAMDSYLQKYPQGQNVAEVENLLSDALINTNNYLRAIEHIERMSNKSPRIRAAYQKVTYYQGITYYRNKRYKEAINYFDKSIAYPVDKSIVHEAFFWKAEAYAAGDNTKEAIRAYEQVTGMRLTSLDPALIRSHYGLGYAYFNTQQYAKAENQFRSYIDKIKKSDVQSYYDDAVMRLGDCYYIQKKFDNALSTFRRAIDDRNPAADYAHYMAGVVLNFQNRNREAIAELDRGLSRYPNSRFKDDIVFQKAQINMEESNYAEARQGYSQLINQSPNSPFVPFALEGRAIASYSLKNYDQTINDYKKILDSYPNATNADAALVGLQEALSLQGRSGEFSNYLSDYKTANPGNESLQSIEFEAAKNLFFNQSYQESIRAFETYLKSYPNSGQKQEANYFIGDAYYRLDQKDQALQTFYDLEGMGASSQRAKAIQRIAEIEFEKKNYQKAIPYFISSSKVARDRIEEYEAYKGLMTAYYETSKFDSASFYADKVIALGDITADAEANALLIKAKSLLKTGKTAAAQDELMVLLNESESIQGAEALYLLSLSFHESGNFTQSNETIFSFSEKYAVYDYWYGKCFVLLAKNYKGLNENFQAKATLESVIENAKNEQIIQEAKAELEAIQ
ncbi:tetratricopeptide repeat protein [Echinicola sp. CAU 1574]|uniref:Tetratricopeptide repeat protein n=1 Tax=Echinicola arenosa TaxID=2774144 RepID=A0ABR9ALE5_9BACT|nr:tetratricopeptide repeat protein [Echinicola arenosa]MBD8489369.1 tetratricopeptide repeat protein [Echinicola arenosa]